MIDACPDSAVLFFDAVSYTHLIDRGYPGMFFIMFVVSLVSSSIALALRRALAQAAASDRRTHMVLETNRMLQRCADEQQIVHAMATQLARLSGCPVVWYSACLLYTSLVAWLGCMAVVEYPSDLNCSAKFPVVSML